MGGPRGAHAETEPESAPLKDDRKDPRGRSLPKSCGEGLGLWRRLHGHRLLEICFRLPGVSHDFAAAGGASPVLLAAPLPTRLERGCRPRLRQPVLACPRLLL